jgi:hypothetical protein
VMVKVLGGEEVIVGVLLGVVVGVVDEVGSGVEVDSDVISISKTLIVGVFVDIGDATEVSVEVKNGVILPSEAQPVRMIHKMINKDDIPILIKIFLLHLVII